MCCCCCCCCCRFLTYRALFANTNLLSAQEVSGWNANIQNLTDGSLHAQWPALTSEISQPVKAYIVHVSWQNGHGGHEETGKILLSNVTSATIGGLDGFSDYSVLIFAIDALGNPYKSSVKNVKTLEGGEWFFCLIVGIVKPHALVILLQKYSWLNQYRIPNSLPNPVMQTQISCIPVIPLITLYIPATRALVQSRTPPPPPNPYCFEIPNPSSEIRQIQDLEKTIGDPINMLFKENVFIHFQLP